MKQHCYLLLVTMVFFICNSTELIAQDSSQTAPEFTLGAFVGAAGQQNVYSSFDSSGMNTILHYANNTTKPYLTGLNVIARNDSSNEDWINHYSTGLYSKWESEENLTGMDTLRVGVKHKDGQAGTWDDKDCWSTKGLSSPVDLLVHGPDYRQEKEYKRWLYASDSLYNYRRINYSVKYRMALDTTSLVNPNEDVCRITVRVRHALWINGTYTGTVPTDTLAGPMTLKVSNFESDESFADFTLDYTYIPKFADNPYEDKIQLPPPGDTTYTDSDPKNGIQFCVEWLRDDTLCTLYIDYVEVYDNYGWNDYVNPLTRNTVITNIKTYAQNYSNWDNIKYWFGQDEPYSLDAYIPMRVVDSLVRSAGGSPLITEFYPSYKVTVNGDSQLVKYYNMVKPEKLMIDFYPFSKNYYPIRPVDLEATRNQFQIAHSLQPGFWYVAQGFGIRNLADSSWCSWRRPDSSELKATVMLALAHGVKGIMFWKYESYDTDQCSVDGYFDNIVGKSPNFTPSELFHLIRNNFAPRLKGNLGKTLLTLDYKGDYLQLKYIPPTYSASTASFDYLTLNRNTTDSINFHAGFLENDNQSDNKSFLLANLFPSASREVNITVTNNFSNYYNMRFRNIEPQFNFDTTFVDSINIVYDFLAGDGYLFQVAPVVKYGGRLIYDETVANGTTLRDDMTIENGAALTVTGAYTASGNIIVKDGSIVTTGSGAITFLGGNKLIIEGTADINGTAQNKLEIDFYAPLSGNGILVDSLGSLDIKNCLIKNAAIGISVQPYYYHIDIDSVDFEDCDYCISISGPTSGRDLIGIPYIQNSTIESSEYGIVGLNLSEIIVKDNTITDTDLGISFSNVSTSTVLRNVITSENEELQGILFVSSGGAIRGNTIEGHTNGIQLGNSSPDIGDNVITDNLYHGLYVGSGSLPNMVLKLVGNPGVIYPISGYNEIKENGGYNVDGGPADDDGSEVFIFNANVKMKGGCNMIFDDRTPSPPLDTTLLLMNGYSLGFPIVVQADSNYWGDTVYAARFGDGDDLNVDFEPYFLDPCSLPQQRGGGGGLMLMSSGGEVIDTLYPIERTVPELSATELLYAEAEEDFITANYTDAKELYEQILNSQAPLDEKVNAYKRVYQIGKLTNQSPEFFSDLGVTFSSVASAAEDSLMKKIFGQFSTLCLVSEGEYISAITEFDEVVQQNQGSEEAVYAEIDALTTALLVEGNDSTLQKGSLGKYLVKTPAGYFEKLNGLLRKHFGANNETAKENLLPKEYTLYQNYPNPFNPVTTIEYDLPRAGRVKLVVYDILGREVKTLINTQQEGGRYRVNFNASSLASGVYFYRLESNKFVEVKKMILLK